MNLPNKEKTFHFEFEGASGIKYEGRFTVLCSLNVGQKHAMALEKTRLLGSYPNPTDDLAGLAIVLSNLRAKIVDGPEWYKQSNGGSLIEDEDTLISLYRRIQDAELEWKEELKKKTQPNPDQTQSSNQ